MIVDVQQDQVQGEKGPRLLGADIPGIVKACTVEEECGRKAVSPRKASEQSPLLEFRLKPQLSTKDRHEVKGVAVELLDKLKGEPLNVEYWNDKTSTAADVRNLINMYLFEKLPEPYTQSDIDEKTITLFNHLKSTYYGGGRSAYA
jgi:hypothetical protein